MENRRLNSEELAIVEMLGTEIAVLDDMIETSNDERNREQWRDEQHELIVRMNRLLGTDHIAAGSTITVINNDLNSD